MKKRIIFIIIVLLIVGAAAAVIYTTAARSNKNNLYIQGCEYIESGDYKSAEACFSQLKGYLDSDELYTESHYQYAVELMEQNELETALSMFQEIPEYRESAAHIDSIFYSLLIAAIDAHEMEKASEYAEQIPEYQDVEYKKQYISYLNYLDLLNQGDAAKAEEIKNTISDTGLKTKAERIYEFSTHGAPILTDLKGIFETEGAVIDINEVRCYQYAYNNDVEVPVYLVSTEYTDASGNKMPRYIVYMDMTYYGFCDTIVRAELNMQDEQQLYTFLKIGNYWDAESTYILSTGLMKALAGL